MSYRIKITPRAERETIIEKRLENSKVLGETIYDFRSSEFKPKVISLSIDLPVYRMENCRAFSAQQSEIAREGLEKDFFAKGQELNTAQQAQHEILIKLARQGTESVTPIIDELGKDGQRENILITSTGVVVNGNRRLSAMRELMRKSDGSVDERFTNVRCEVLPSDTTRDEIDDIEADLQARPQTKLDYDWIGDARLVRRQVDKGRSTKEVADRLRRSKSDIENVLQALDEADLYLSEWVNKPGQYEFVSEGQQLFSDIPKSIANKDSNLQDASRTIAWTLYENRERLSGRVYRLNPAFGKLATNVLSILEEQLEFQNGVEDNPMDNDDITVDIDSDDNLEDYTHIIETLKSEENKEETIDILIEACENAIELHKGQRNEQAALKALSQVNSKVISIDVAVAGIKTLPAIKKQIEAIRKGLDKIEAVIQSRQESNSADEKS